MKKMIQTMMGIFLVGTVFAEDPGSNRIAVLEKQIGALAEEVAGLKADHAVVDEEITAIKAVSQAGSPLRLGGYGEIHANFGDKDLFDIHRLVMYAGYDFNDWIKLNSEIELEHAFVNDGSGGEISIEQLYVDFLLSDAVNVRAGRMLAPMGIINQYHEPTLFLGVERPNVEKYIIPSTWSVDGVGFFGAPLSWLNYEIYGVAGLDGSKFDDSNGIRKGRIKERADLGDPAVTGRIDLFPLVNADLPAGQDLRLGFSGYCGGTDNVNKGGGNSVNNTFRMLSADFEYDVCRFRFRGVVAHGKNSNTEGLNTAFGKDAADAIFGWYLEGGVSVLPESWKTGRFEQADLIPFVRYEEYDTQHRAASGTVKDPANDRTEVTVGVNVPLTPQFVLKGDYQFRKDMKNQFNLGMGWIFN